MELQDYLRVLRHRWVTVLLVTLSTLAIGGFLTYRATPQYTSTSRVFVSTSPSSIDAAYAGGLFSQQRVKSYADLLTGLELTQRVVEELRLRVTPEELSQRIEASVVPDTVLLSISVTDPDPQRAQRINEVLVDELATFVKDLETPAGKETALLKTTVVDPARLPEDPTSPNPVRNLGFALVLGFVGGLGLALIRELLDTTIKSPEAAQEATGAPALGGIGVDENHGGTLINDMPSHAPWVEAFRVLRTNVQFLDVDHRSKIFVLTSAMSGEGKSTVASNLALAMAQGGQRVLLVDGDLRRPTVAERLGLEPGVGLTTALLGKISLDDALQKHAGTDLTVLTSGAVPPNPAELLQSQAMEDLLAGLRARFDVVIIDSPPLLPVTDAALLASSTDGAILVINHGTTKRDQVIGAVERLRGVGASPLGLVVNRAPAKGYGYGYGYGYGTGGEDITHSGESPAAEKVNRRRQDGSPSTRSAKGSRKAT